MAAHARLGEAVDGLASTSTHVVLDHFMGPDDAASIRAALLELLQTPNENGQARFKLGELAGDDGYWTTKQDIAKRSDFIYWITEGELSQPRAQDSEPSSAPPHLTALRLYFESARRLGLDILKAAQDAKCPSLVLTAGSSDEQPPSLSCDRMMLAAYPTSTPSRFSLHIDNPNRNGRILTFTYYLNPDWDSRKFGGELLLDLPHGAVKVDPLFDRLIVFFADSRVPHEVLPTTPCQEAPPFRLSIALWMSYVSPQQVLDTYKGSFASWIAAIKRRKEEAKASSQAVNGS